LWRTRSAALNRHYAGLYRGAFLLNYFLATIAVLLAALSLALLGYAHVFSLHGVSPTAFAWLFPSLLVLGTLKLVCVSTIYLNTHNANHNEWNERAVDYRYLAERLRTMLYLPGAGSFKPPTATPPQYASRAVRQSAVDWLFDAIVRSVSPTKMLAKPIQKTVNLPMIKPDYVLKELRDSWIREQAEYHDSNARTMDRIHNFAAHLGKFLNIGVIAIVILDILLILADLFAPVSEDLARTLHSCTPLLLFLSAVFPAAVAALNGIRYQSECRRLSERSARMRAILFGRTVAPPKETVGNTNGGKARSTRSWWSQLRSGFTPKSLNLPIPPLTSGPGGKANEADHLLFEIQQAKGDPSANLGSWTAEVLRFAESVADVMIQDVAEWSVLYAKEVAEP
jgi:hypothetical protein